MKRDYTKELFDIKQRWVNKIVNNELNSVLGPLACGTAVIGNSQVLQDMIKSYSRKTAGLDMESYEIFYAANYGVEKIQYPYI